MAQIENNDENTSSNTKKSVFSSKMSSVVTLMFISILVLALAFVVSKARMRNKDFNKNYINTEGEAECDIEADTAEWSIYFERVGEKQSDIAKILEEEKQQAIKFLVKKGIDNDEIEIFDYIKKNRNSNKDNNERASYRIGYCVYIKTKKIDLIIKLKSNLSELHKEDIGFVRNTLNVTYSKQKEVEQALCKKATQNAIDKATDLTDFLKIDLGKIQRIDTPRFYTTTLIPNFDTLNNAKLMMGSSHNNGTSAKSTMKKRKVKAHISLQIGIK